MATTTATPDQVAEAVRINEGARLRALQASFLMLAVFALLAVIPALGLPRYSPNEIPDMLAKKEKKGKKNPAAVVTPAT